MYTSSMNYTYKLNSSLVKNYLSRRFLKREFLTFNLGCSGDLVKKMMSGHVPKDETLEALANLIGVKKEELLVKHGE